MDLCVHERIRPRETFGTAPSPGREGGRARSVSCIAAVAGLVAVLAACAHAVPQPAARAPVPVRLLAINDFHGHLEPSADGQAPGAVQLEASLREARVGHEGRSLVLHAGDLVGASPAVSALLQDEPSVEFFGLLGNDRCLPAALRPPGALAPSAGDPGCDLVGTLGNHELDEGLPELRRLLLGGDHRRGPFLARPWLGARFPVVCANLVDRATGQPVFPAFLVREVGGVRVGVVGAVRDDLATKLAPSRLGGLAVRPTSGAVNQAVAELRALGVRTIVVLLHHGGRQLPYDGPTQPGAVPPTGIIAPLVASFDGEVDVVLSGDEHQFTNAILPAADGRLVLVTQALDRGRAYAQVDLDIDPQSGDVLAKRATIRKVPAPGPAVPALVEAAGESVRAVTRRQVATAAEPIPRQAPGGEEGAGESPLGDLVADAMRAATGADLAALNAGGLRADLPAGTVTFGHLFAVLPFGGALVTVRVSGRQLRAILEQQWLGQPEPRRLQISGFEFTWDARQQPGDRVVALARGGKPVEDQAAFSMALPEFLAEGGDGFSAAAEAARGGRTAGKDDLEALEAYLRRAPQPLRASVDGRIRRTP